MGQRLYWIDLETTGLDPGRDHILEIALFEATPEDPANIYPEHTEKLLERLAGGAK